LEGAMSIICSHYCQLTQEESAIDLVCRSCAKTYLSTI